MTRPVAVLVGPPGAGKTTIGQLLAERLGTNFRDVDHDIEAAAGKPISDIFVDDGEPAFRALEVAAVRTALETHDGVLALGGGAVLAEATRKALTGHRVVFLDVGLSDAADRVGLNTARPLLALNPRAALRTMLAERAPIYAEVATVTVTTDGRTPDDILAEVVAQLDEVPA
ncbi:shikimate kinase [Cryptosporangium phraense]|uniref:Shikimate kinase n=1 Tax=Cryptosporangium phraense TaxID=2593070 RepID=A0A545AJV3_9ACTN|nr:shikimate kinase [Cryptosporangium phraense]TQS41617.1 shikimate kinase [Cryptosporangium phraense]